MQVYIDESISPDGKVSVLAALAIYDNRSKSTISKIVSQTVLRLKDHLKHNAEANFKKLPQGRILELKGAQQRNKEYIPGLNDYPHIRDRFFQELVEQANFSLHILYIDFEDFRQPLKNTEYKKYGFFLQNLLRTIPIIPKNARLFSVTIDSQATAKPAQEGSKLHKWRKRKRAQRRQRIHDKKKHRSWIQRLDNLIRVTYTGKQINRKIWIVPSHQDRCLQAIDVISNFSFKYRKLKLKLPPYKVKSYPRKLKQWFGAFDIIKARTFWIHNPPLRRAKRPYKFQS